MRKWWVGLTLLLLITGMIPIRAKAQQTLIVFAASSLTDAFEEIASAFETEYPEVVVLFSFAGSSDLAAQILEGAPADVFASANNIQMERVREGGRIGSVPYTFAKNRLVLIVPSDNPARLTSLKDLSRRGVKLILAGPNVPARTYTNTMLERLAADPAYGESYRLAVLANIVSEEQNVRQVAAKIALGEGDAGIVYVSDVTPDIRDKVLIIPIPDAVNTIASYPIAVTHDSAHPQTAQAFVNFVLSDAGQDILAHWNFTSVRHPQRPHQEMSPVSRRVLDAHHP